MCAYVCWRASSDAIDILIPTAGLTDLFVFYVQNDAFSETSGILAGTFRRMNNMAERQGCRWLWYIIFIVLVFWFFIVVWWFRR
jgi:hypothetical protein